MTRTATIVCMYRTEILIDVRPFQSPSTESINHYYRKKEIHSYHIRTNGCDDTDALKRISLVIIDDINDYRPIQSPPSETEIGIS